MLKMCFSIFSQKLLVNLTNNYSKYYKGKLKSFKTYSKLHKIKYKIVLYSTLLKSTNMFILGTLKVLICII